MSFTTWLLVGLGVFIIYSAYKGNNPLASLASHLGAPSKSPAKLQGAR